MSRDYRLLCLGNDRIPSGFREEITSLLSDLSVTFTESTTASQVYFQIQSIGNLHWPSLSSLLMKITEQHKIDFSFSEIPAARDIRLMVFDMDSTLVNAEVIDEMGKVQGIGDKIARITERAMNGEINFDQSLIERVALLKGMPVRAMEEIEKNIGINPGVEELMKHATSKGIKTAIVSGGFNYFANSLKIKLGMSDHRANELEVIEDRLTGRVLGKIVNAKGKEDYLEGLRISEGLSPHQVVAVGDGANDLLMLQKAGMGVAWHAKTKVKEVISHQITFGPMTHLLHFIGDAK